MTFNQFCTNQGVTPTERMQLYAHLLIQRWYAEKTLLDHIRAVEMATGKQVVLKQRRGHDTKP